MQEIDEKIAALEKRKAELVSKAKNLDARMRYKTLEAAALREVLKNERAPIAGRLRRELEILEFRVATEALNLQSERRFMKEIKEVQKELGKASEAERKRKKLQFVEGDIKFAEFERGKVEEEIQKVKKEIDEAWDEKRLGKKREEGEEKRREEAKKFAEYAPAQDQAGGFVSLGEIAVIKKKG